MKNAIDMILFILIFSQLSQANMALPTKNSAHLNTSPLNLCPVIGKAKVKMRYTRETEAGVQVDCQIQGETLVIDARPDGQCIVPDTGLLQLACPQDPETSIRTYGAITTNIDTQKDELLFLGIKSRFVSAEFRLESLVAQAIGKSLKLSKVKNLRARAVQQDTEFLTSTFVDEQIDLKVKKANKTN